MTAIQTHLLSLITAIVGIAVGFGIVDNETAGSIIAAAGVILGAVLQIANVFHVKIATEASTAVAQIATK